MKKLTIVVADDNPIDKFSHAKIASELGHHVLAVVEDGIELINACRQFQPLLSSKLKFGTRLAGI
jgi:AmiR/NasT family two-component response regulator